MRLLTAHKILISFALAMAAALTLWGASHRRREGAWVALVLGVLMLPTLGLYLRKLFRNPPLK